MKVAELHALLRDENPGAGITGPTGREWGGKIDALMIETARLSAHILIRDESELNAAVRHGQWISMSMTETWVFTRPALVRTVLASISSCAGVRVTLPDGRVGIARAATVRDVDVTAWILRLHEAEMVTLSNILECEGDPYQIAKEGLAQMGDDGLKALVSSIIGGRCICPPLPPADLDDRKLLAAVRRRLHHEPVVMYQ